MRPCRQGHLLFSTSLDELKESLHGFRLILKDEQSAAKLETVPGLIEHRRHQRIHTLVAEGDRPSLEKHLQQLAPVFMEPLDLSLEDIFIILMRQKGYGYDTAEESA